MPIHSRIKPAFLLRIVCLFAGGCAGVDRMGAKLDMAAEHLSAPKPLYEGQITAVGTVGAMTSLQFTDGELFDVRTAPAGLRPGDIVRIYSEKDEYSAHLWHTVESSPPSPEAQALAPLIEPAK